jgi:hypothetical protein
VFRIIGFAAWLFYSEQFFFCSCVENRPFRLGKINDAELGKYYHDQKPWLEKVQVSEDRSYHISFVEFDEKGDFWDRRQLARTARMIRWPNYQPGDQTIVA